MLNLDEQYTIEENGDFLLVKVKNKIIDEANFSSLIRFFNPNKIMLLNLENVETINSRLFIECLSKRKIALFNAKCEVLVYLSIVLKSNFLNSYIRIDDFKNKKYELIKRKFKIA